METTPAKFQRAPTSEVISHESQVKGVGDVPRGDNRSESENSADATWIANDHVTSLASILEPMSEVRVSQHLDVVEG